MEALVWRMERWLCEKKNSLIRYSCSLPISSAIAPLSHPPAPQVGPELAHPRCLSWDPSLNFVALGYSSQVGVLVCLLE